MKGDVSSRILAILRELRLTQSDLAAIIGIDRGYLSRMEAGKINITIEVMCRYLDAVKAEIAIDKEDG